MGTYMYPIQVRESQQEIRYERNVTIYGSLTMKELPKVVKPKEYFYVFPQDGGLMSDAYLLEIHGKEFKQKKKQKKEVLRKRNIWKRIINFMLIKNKSFFVCLFKNYYFNLHNIYKSLKT